MPLILVELPEYVAVEKARADFERELVGLECTVTVEPSVYVVPGELSDEPAVFAREEDAETFANTYDPPRGVFRLLIADAQVAAAMAHDRLDDCPECGKKVGEDGREATLCEHCGADLCDRERADGPNHDEADLDRLEQEGLIEPDGTFTITEGGKTTAPIPYDASMEELEAARAKLIDWSGVLWDHAEGAPIEATNDAAGERFSYDDMIAALYVASNGFPWLLYEDAVNTPDGGYLPWQVSAFKTKERALEELSRVSAPYAFVFDGRLGIEQVRTNMTPGFRPRVGADVTIKQQTEGL